MSKSFRFFIVLAVLVLSGALLYPSVNWYFLTKPAEHSLAERSRDQIRSVSVYYSEYYKEAIQAALSAPNADLTAPVSVGEPRDFWARWLTLTQGKPSLQIDKNAVFAGLKAQDAEAPKVENPWFNGVLKAKFAEKGLPEPAKWTLADLKKAFSAPEDFTKALEEHFRTYAQALKDSKKSILHLGLDLSGGMSIVLKADLATYAKKQQEKRNDPNYQLTTEDSDEAIGRAMEVLLSRIDQFGVSEPQIKREKGGQKIYIDIPGEYDEEKVNTFLSGKGSLFFKIVDDAKSSAVNQWVQSNPDAVDQSTFVLLQAPPADIVPAGFKVLRYFIKDNYGLDRFQRFIVVSDDPSTILDGIHVNTARVDRDPITNRPQVTFSMTKEGGDIFRGITRANKGKPLAVVLDDKVKFSATIRDEIPNGQVQVTGFDQKESSDIAKTLRTGALEVQLTVESQQAVGASLGLDAINSGVNASYVGFLLVAVFMLIYYKGAGINANIALIFNVIIIAGVMSTLGQTITLASIASLLLTVGISVDANVIVFERIKEEYWQGKSPSHAIKTGFERAFWTIMDSHVTAFIAAFFLSLLSNGPVKGFAITLAIGLVTSMFTALFVSRLLFDFRTETLKAKRISITWRKM